MSRPPKYRKHTVRDLGFVEYEKKRTYFPGAFESDESMAAYLRFCRDRGFLVYRRGEKPENACTVPILVARFMAWAKATFPFGRKSRAANLKAFTNLLSEFIGVDYAANLTPLRLKAFQQWLIDEKNLSRRYINDTTAAIRQLYKWGVSEELIPLAAYQSLLTVPGLALGRTTARETAPRQPVQWEHVKATMAQLRRPVRDMVELQWLTGARSQSICSAMASQFDCTTQPWEWRPKHKTERLGHVLVVFIGQRGQKLLAPYLKGRQNGDYLFQPRNKGGKRSRLYRSRYDADTYRRAVERAAVAAKVPHWTPHQLRHARGTIVREQYGLEAAQAYLGHKRLTATQIYAKALLDKAREVAIDIG